VAQGDKGSRSGNTPFDSLRGSHAKRLSAVFFFDMFQAPLKASPPKSDDPSQLPDPNQILGLVPSHRRRKWILLTILLLVLALVVSVVGLLIARQHAPVAPNFETAEVSGYRARLMWTDMWVFVVNAMLLIKTLKAKWRFNGLCSGSCLGRRWFALQRARSAT
jgi:hypothetical protein